MADFTPNKMLELPKSNEKYDVDVANKNNMVIDSEIHKLELKNQAQDELLATKESLNSEISRAKLAEADINNSIESEIDRATNAERDIANELNNYLPLTGGAIGGNSNPLLSLIRFDGAFTGLDFENPSGHLFSIEGYSAEDGTGKQLNVFARDWNKSLLRINEANRVIYDYATKSEKKILVEGEALPLSGGTISGNSNQLFAIKNITDTGSAALKLIPGNGEKGHILVQSNYRENGNQFLVVRVNENGEWINIFTISENMRQIYDYKTGTTKEILVTGEALPSTGGTITSTNQQMLNLRYAGEKGDAIIQLFPDNSTTKRIAVQSAYTDAQGTIFKVFKIEEGVITQLLQLSGTQKTVFDPKTNVMKDIMVKGDSITPTVKETIFKIKSRELSITGVIGNEQTDITDIIIKAYGGSNLNEGMRVGISPSNGMGYIQAQNFVIDCNLLTLEETRLLQTFYSVRFSRANDSNDYPLLMPATQDFEAGFLFTNKDGRSNITTKAKILSDSSNNFFQYDLPSVFKNDKDSGTNLKLESKEWLVATGIDIKNRG